MLAPVAVSFARLVYGADAARHLDGQIRLTKQDDLLAAVSVVAPSVHSAAQLRISLGRAGQGLVNVRFLLLSDLAKLYGGLALRQERRSPLTRSALLAAIRTVLAEHPGRLSEVVSHPSTEIELANCYEELRRVPAESQQSLAGRGPQQAELVAFCRLVRSRLEEHFYDDVDLFASAVNALSTKVSSDELSTLIVHLPDRLRVEEAALIAALARDSPVLVNLGYSADAFSDQHSDALRQMIGDAVLLSPAELSSSAAPGPNRRPPASSDSPCLGEQSRFPSPLAFEAGRDELVLAPDAPAEVREALRVVIEHLGAGGRPEAIAVLYPARDPYAGLLQSAFLAAGIASRMSARTTMEAVPAARFLTTLLSLRARSYPRAAVLELLAFTRWCGSSQDEVPLGEWDRCTRLAGVIEGRAQFWHERLADLASSAHNDLFSSDLRRSRRAERTLTACAGLSRFLTAVDEQLELLLALGSWSQYATWARQAIETFFGRVDQDQPAEELAGGEALLAVLDELSLLEPVASLPGIEEFAAALQSGLRRPAPAIGRVGSGVLLAPLEQGVGLCLELLVVLGCSETHLPRRPSPGPLLSVTDRMVIGLPAVDAPAAIVNDRRLLAAARASADRRVLICPRTEQGSGRPQTLSRLLTGWPARPASSVVSVLSSVAAGSSLPVSTDELECASVFAARGRGEDLAQHHLARSSEDFARSLQAVSSRSARQFDAFSGRIATAGMSRSLTEVPFGPTTLESYATCPFRYFASHLLSLEVLDEPDRRLRIDARERGSLVHEVLERFVAKLISEGELDDEKERQLLQELAEQVLERYERFGKTGKRVLWQLDRRRLLALLESERRSDRVRRALLGRRPIAVEQVFGSAGAEPVSWAKDSYRLLFRGVIDRVDLGADGSLFVTDYKTGRSDNYRALTDDPVDRGRHLQLPVYALAARAAFPDSTQVHAAYRFLDHDGEELSVTLNQATTDRFDEVLTSLVSNIDAGIFPYHPGAADRSSYTNCRFCDFEHLCPADRATRWELNRKSPELASYAALAEPAAEADDVGQALSR